MAGKMIDPKKVRCSFCGRPQEMTHRMVAGPEGIYICDDCGFFLDRQDLSIHVPLDPNASKIHTEPYSEDYPALGMEYVLPMEIMYQYRLVKEYTHYCPDCKSPLHKYRGTDILKCPECGEYAMTWDGVPLWSVKKRSPSESA